MKEIYILVFYLVSLTFQTNWWWTFLFVLYFVLVKHILKSEIPILNYIYIFKKTKKTLINSKITHRIWVKYRSISHPFVTVLKTSDIKSAENNWHQNKHNTTATEEPLSTTLSAQCGQLLRDHRSRKL